MNSIVSIEEAKKLAKQLHAQNKSIVLAGGCFDMLHFGHITFLKKAKEKGDVLFVMVESDKSVKQHKGVDRPIHAQRQRSQLVASVRFVDFVIELPFFTKNEQYDNLVKLISPAIIAATLPDIQIGHKIRQARIVGAKVVYVTRQLQQVSTSKILETLAKEL